MTYSEFLAPTGHRCLRGSEHGARASTTRLVRAVNLPEARAHQGEDGHSDACHGWAAFIGEVSSGKFCAHPCGRRSHRERGGTREPNSPRATP